MNENVNTENEREHKWDEVPDAIPGQTTYKAMLIDGLVDVLIFFLYIFLFRSWIAFHTSPLLIKGIVEMRPIVIFDVIVVLEFIMAIFELVGFLILKKNKNRETLLVKQIKRVFMLSHIFLIPAGILLDLVLQFIGL